jgi:hypothetical protein
MNAAAMNDEVEAACLSFIAAAFIVPVSYFFFRVEGGFLFPAAVEM